MALGSFLLLVFNLAVISLYGLVLIPLHFECELYRCVKVLLFPITKLGLFVLIKVFSRLFLFKLALLQLLFFEDFLVEEDDILAVLNGC